MIALRDFSKGINSKDAGNLIPDNALSLAENAVISRGFVAKRSGYERYAAGQIERRALWSDVGGKKWSEL